VPITHPALVLENIYLERFFQPLTPVESLFFNTMEKSNSTANCAPLGELLAKTQLMWAFVGIGWKRSPRFNDPSGRLLRRGAFPLYFVVDLPIMPCRMQHLVKVGFPSLEAVPQQGQSACFYSANHEIESHLFFFSFFGLRWPDTRKALAIKKCMGRLPYQIHHRLQILPNHLRITTLF